MVTIAHIRYARLAFIAFACALACDARDRNSEPQTNQDSNSREFWITQWDMLDRNGNLTHRYSERAKALARVFKSATGKIGPHLLDAFAGHNNSPSNGNEYGLVVDYYDETGTLSGFVIREYNENDHLLVEES